MGIAEDWPEYDPDTKLVVSITSGTATLTSASKLENKGDFDLAQIAAAVFKNGAFEAGIAVHPVTGVLSLDSGISVSTDDTLEFRFIAQMQLSLPWISRVVFKRAAFMTVASGDSTTTFDSTTNAMPVPGINIAFGFTAAPDFDFKVGMKVAGADGASEDLRVTTRLTDCPDDGTYVDIDLGNTSTAPTHTADFSMMDATDAAIELKAELASGTTNPRQTSSWRVLFWDRGQVPIYPTGFPTSGTLLVQSKVGSGMKLNDP